MATVLKIELPFECIFGKISKNSDLVFRRRNVNDHQKIEVYAFHPYQGEYSEAQKAQQNKFKLANEAKKNLTEEQKAAYKNAFTKQNKYHNLNGYIIAMEIKKIENNNN